MFDPTFKEFCMRPSWLKIPTASNMRNSNLLYSVYIFLHHPGIVGLQSYFPFWSIKWINFSGLSVFTEHLLGDGENEAQPPEG